MPILDLFSFGGVVMWPLLGFSILAVTLILERIVFWLKVTQRQKNVVRRLIALYRRNIDTPDIDTNILESLQENEDLPLVRIFRAALELENPTPEEFRLALESAAQAELPLLKRFNTVLETIISLAPLLGLLGTVLGLISSFAALKIGDVGGSKTTGVTAGISEALISTAAGLVVAIFTLLFANMFRGLYRQQIALIQEYAGRLELIYRRKYQLINRQLDKIKFIDKEREQGTVKKIV